MCCRTGAFDESRCENDYANRGDKLNNKKDCWLCLLSQMWFLRAQRRGGCSEFWLWSPSSGCPGGRWDCGWATSKSYKLRIQSCNWGDGARAEHDTCKESSDSWARIQTGQAAPFDRRAICKWHCRQMDWAQQLLGTSPSPRLTAREDGDGKQPGLHKDVALDEGSANFCLGGSWLGFRWERAPRALILRRQPCDARRGSLWVCGGSCRGGETFRRKDHRSPSCSRCRWAAPHHLVGSRNRTCSHETMWRSKAACWMSYGITPCNPGVAVAVAAAEHPSPSSGEQKPSWFQRSNIAKPSGIPNIRWNGNCGWEVNFPKVDFEGTRSGKSKVFSEKLHGPRHLRGEGQSRVKPGKKPRKSHGC